MRPAAVPCAELREIARHQHDVITVAQALEQGLPYASIRRYVRDGTWHRLTRGIVLARATDPTVTDLCLAGLIRGGAGSAIGGWAAAHLLGLATSTTLPPVIDVWVPEGRARRPTGRWLFHQDGQGRLGRSLGDPATIPIEHLLADLCPELGAGEMIDVVTRALGQRLTTEAGLIAVLERRPRSGQSLLLEMVRDSSGLHSVLEYRFDERVLRPHGLPSGIRQAARSGHVHDLLYDEHCVVVELDGRLGHWGPDRFRDFHRDNVSAANGLVTLRFGWSDVMTRPCAVAGVLDITLRRRGWNGRRMLCERCG
ncbi:type IV toxin-antitoxin system AbiEi family antitoxin domain-containing protein [Raineyella sp. LH-20]|uniref:type IV toxin-antitoxin system AbiEi family antitoxin domain-containing protein n=1 Tax=Raineyella sp. LH-20 TaxID=3081204 RepID=UPI002953733B|nr:type IV toxin-antitoxin system AbiEi family antitoxin domain-containing protein [Raineyella sp. LH-20]WOP17597.1 type IV toxin-antitoxin system AbiEi family antitoxin domain-containing protein [Raineyella sp. LH-20]